jgi:hypothetical protein
MTLKLPDYLFGCELGFGHFRAAAGPESVVIEPGAFG